VIHTHTRTYVRTNCFFSLGLYGFSATSPVNFTKTRILRESYLAEKRIREPLFADSRLQISLLGVLEKPGDRKPPELLFSVTTQQLKAKIKNQVQSSGCILGESKNIFFGLVLSVLRVFDPRKLEVSYAG
jgi:hypothetical protein